MLCIKLLDDQCRTVVVAKGEDEVNLVCSRNYEEGDRIIIESSEKNVFLWIQFDDAIGKSMVFLKDNVDFKIPFHEKRINLPPKAYTGDKHLICAKMARSYEVFQYRNLAYSAVDYHENKAFYPHVSANVETRGESVFAAQNVIDGVTANTSHGEWPYESWGINQQKDARLRLDFGRKVKIDRIVLYIRADFPHDSWWRKVELTYSDQSRLTLELKRTGQAQEFVIEPKETQWIELGNLVQADSASPFPALSQIEVYGVEVEEIERDGD